MPPASESQVNFWRRAADFFGLKRNLVVLLIATFVIGSGEELWMRFVPKYLQALGATVFVIGLFDALRTLLGAVYAYPGGVLVDRWGHRRAFLAFNVFSIAGYSLVLLVPHWGAVIAGMFLFLSWTCFSLPATFSLVGATLGANRHSMGVGIQSVIKRLPIMVAPIVGGILIDRFGIINGVRIGLIVSIFLSAATILVQRQLREAPTPAVARPDRWTFWQSLRGFNAPLRRLLLSDILVRFCERIPFAWVVIYAMDNIGVSAKQVGILTTVEMLAATLCIIPASHFADKHGREPFHPRDIRFLHSLPDRVLDLRQLRPASAGVRDPRTEGIRRHLAQSLDHRLLRARAARPNDRRLLPRPRSPREFGGDPRRLALEAGTFHELSWRSRVRRLRHHLLHLHPPARSSRPVSSLSLSTAVCR